MKKLKESELILNPDGSLYHINLGPGQLASKIILVGDPQRVSLISKHFDTVEYRTENREIHTHTGMLNNVRISVMSTGMGPDNIDIVMNEIDAVVNIDLNTRQPKARHTGLEIVRLGTSGSLQSDIPVDDFCMATHGLGMDGLLHFYRHSNVNEQEIADAFIRQTDWPHELAVPYVVKGSGRLAEMIGSDLHQGITITAPGFYGPQGRSLRLETAYAGLNDRITAFKHHHHRILNFEMETSALYAMGRLLGHQTLTVCTILANRVTGSYSHQPKRSIEKLIKLVLERLTQQG
ncbi:MAG: nucleoside phosphorylase [Bacteroidales bacterium]|nr:nucleoside phosphorylase [Bacteroidales bacterium]